MSIFIIFSVIPDIFAQCRNNQIEFWNDSNFPGDDISTTTVARVEKCLTIKIFDKDLG